MPVYCPLDTADRIERAEVSTTVTENTTYTVPRNPSRPRRSWPTIAAQTETKPHSHSPPAKRPHGRPHPLQVRIPPSRVDPLQPQKVQRLLLRLRIELLRIVPSRSSRHPVSSRKPPATKKRRRDAHPRAVKLHPVLVLRPLPDVPLEHDRAGPVAVSRLNT